MAGTAVLAAAGYVAIEDIRKGDYVWSWDEETGEKALKQVTETYVSETDELVHLYARGEQIDTTPGHPFYVDGKGWYPAESLRAGDILVTINGERVILELVQHEILESPVRVYNLEVQDYHTYYVDKIGILIHNSCPRRDAVRKAWKKEQENVRNGGRGISRTWTKAERDELLATGKVKGYHGHHIKSVKGYPSLAGKPKNIQFLTPKEHLAAHGGDWRNITHVRYRVQ